MFIISCGESIPYRERKEICYKALDIEKEAGFKIPEEDYKLLDKILYEIEKEIVIKKSYTEDEAKEILRKIGFIIRRNNINNYDGIDFYLLSKSIQGRKFTCLPFVLIFISIAERFQLPLWGISAPDHIFVLWEDKSNNIYWETTLNCSLKINAIINYF